MMGKWDYLAAFEVDDIQHEAGECLHALRDLIDENTRLKWFIEGLEDAGMIHDTTIVMQRETGGNYGESARYLLKELLGNAT